MPSEIGADAEGTTTSCGPRVMPRLARTSPTVPPKTPTDEDAPSTDSVTDLFQCAAPRVPATTAVRTAPWVRRRRGREITMLQGVAPIRALLTGLAHGKGARAVRAPSGVPPGTSRTPANVT